MFAASIARGQNIDFSSLSGADVSDGNGQNFAWSFRAQSGTVNVRATWTNVFAVDGRIRTPVPHPATLESPFTGNVTFTFDAPVEVAFLATFASLVNDEDSSGRFFERVRLSSPGRGTISARHATTAAYTGVGTNNISAEDVFNTLPNLSIWGVTGSGQSTTYELQYTGTRSGLSETFNVRVIPEPSAIASWRCACGTRSPRRRLPLHVRTVAARSGAAIKSLFRATLAASSAAGSRYACKPWMTTSRNSRARRAWLSISSGVVGRIFGIEMFSQQSGIARPVKATLCKSR